MSNTPRPEIPFYILRHLNSARVKEMTLEEEGAYLRALFFYYSNGELPSNPSVLARLIGKGCTVEIAMKVASMFRPHPKYSITLLYHDMEEVLKSISEEPFIKKESEEDPTQLDIFLAFYKRSIQDEPFVNSIAEMYRLDLHIVQELLKKFTLKHVGTKEYKLLLTYDDYCKKAFHSIPYTETYKSIHGNATAKTTRGSTDHIKNWGNGI